MMFKRFSLSKQINTGFILPGVLAFIIAMTIVGGAILTVVLDNFFVVGNNAQSQEAFNIAEAGINYYLWHMAYDGTDFKDGQSTPTTPNPTLGYGPYVLQYKNINNVDIYAMDQSAGWWFNYRDSPLDRPG
jgi:Tfp pilus assembly protein PilX